MIAAAAGATMIAMFAASFLATAGLTWLVLKELRRRAILDRPNDRSSHQRPTPRGGGLGVVPVVVAAWAAVLAFGPAVPGLPLVLIAAALLAVVSWLDDLRGLPPAYRLVAQAAAVAMGLAGLPSDALVFGGIAPLPLDRLAAGILWLWFVNLFNFRDGIDGISGVELASVGGGLALVATIVGNLDGLALLALALVGGAAGFLVWNWHPARVFLGDVGSVPLGYLCGWLLVLAALSGLWWAVAILPLYYLTDATVTLLRRLVRGERIWEAHREHIYQRAVQGGLSHGQVAGRILAANLVLIAAAGLTPAVGAWAIVPAALAVAAVVAVLVKAG